MIVKTILFTMASCFIMGLILFLLGIISCNKGITAGGAVLMGAVIQILFWVLPYVISNPLQKLYSKGIDKLNAYSDKRIEKKLRSLELSVKGNQS